MSKQKAVIYCRVSDVKQTIRGDGLASQETCCREFARYKGYDVVEVYKDDMTGGLAARPAIKRMVAFLRKHRKDDWVVIIDDITRWARDIEAHWELRHMVADTGAKLVSPSMEFGEDADGIMFENILATMSQHQRQKNAEQTKTRMRARVMNGYWVHHPPKGYRFESRRGEGKVMVRDEPLASIIAEALEGFASGRFGAQVEVKRFLESQPAFPKDLPNGEIRHQRVIDLLKQVLYAGYIEAPLWDVPLRKARHDGLISLETFQKNQERLTEGARVANRADLSADFPLRGFVACGDCGKPLTACWSKGKMGTRYAYYLCYNKDCDSYRKSVARSRIEDAFERILRTLQPTPEIAALTRDVLKHVWDRRQSRSAARMKALKAEIAKTQGEIDKLLDRIVDATSPSVITAYEGRIAKLEEAKLIAEEKLRSSGRPAKTFEESFELAMRFLSSPWNIWEKGPLRAKRTVLKLAFDAPLPYCRNQGFRTPKTTLPFNMLGQVSGQNWEMARPGRFELPTS